MPIGFWAVSRDDVRDYINYRLTEIGKETHFLTSKEIEKAVKGVRERLDITLDKAICDFAETLK